MNRYYSSAIGRFLSPDPYRASGGPASPQSWNRYTYVLNDPVNHRDPAGLECYGSDPNDLDCEPDPPPPNADSVGAGADACDSTVDFDRVDGPPASGIGFQQTGCAGMGAEKAAAGNVIWKPRCCNSAVILR